MQAAASFIGFHTEGELSPTVITSKFDGLLRAVLESGLPKFRGTVRTTRDGRHVVKRKVTGENVCVTDRAVTFGARKGLFGGTVSGNVSIGIVHAWVED